MQEDQEKIPRYRIVLQDGLTGVQVAAGTDEMALFTKTDLMKFVRHFKKSVKAIEDEWEEQQKANEPDPWPTRPTGEDNGAADQSSDIPSSGSSGPEPVPDGPVHVPHKASGTGKPRKRAFGDSGKKT